jgi:hypothetical protein
MKTEKVTIGVVAAILLALFVGIITLSTFNGRLRESVNKEKLQSEKLLSEKLLLTKQIDEFRGEIAVLKGKNKEADLRLESANRDLTQMEAQLQRLDKEAAGARQLSQQVAALRKLRENLQAELKGIKSHNGQLEDKNASLSRDLDQLTAERNALLAQNKTLADQVKTLSFTGSNFKVEVLKGKSDKLTVKARRTEKISIGFEVAAGGSALDRQLIHVDLLSPDGSLLEGKPEVAVEGGSPLSASTDEGVTTPGSQKVSITYAPKEKLKKGTYTAIVFHGNTLLGKAQFRLMK